MLGLANSPDVSNFAPTPTQSDIARSAVMNSASMESLKRDILSDISKLPTGDDSIGIFIVFCITQFHYLPIFSCRLNSRVFYSYR